MKILFVCKHNRFRSKVAESIFDKLNKNSKISCESAGLMIDDLRDYIANNVLEIMNQKGYEIKIGSKQIDKNEINNFDKIIIVANNVDDNYFYNFKGNIIQWDIEDCDENNKNKILDIINKIEKNVKILIKNFE